MAIAVRPSSFEEIAPLREAFRREAGCQIVRDSILGRGMADAWVVTRHERTVAYGGIWKEHFPGRVMEFHAVAGARADALAHFRAFLTETRATQVEAQTNIPFLHHLLQATTRNVTEEHLLFREGSGTDLPPPGGTFRKRRAGDDGPEGPWVLEVEGRVVAAGGVLTHYNPPWADLFLEVVEDARGRGVGRWFVQELRRVCRAGGLTPAARCAPSNPASRRALESGGLIRCGSLVSGDV